MSHGTGSTPDTATDPRTARLAGALYLAIIVLGVWSEAGVRSALVLPGDPAGTAANILAAEGLFRLSFAADTVMAACDVALAVLLFLLLRPVSETLALMAMLFRLVQTALVGGNLLNQHTALLILGGSTPLPAFSGDQASALAALALDAHSHGYDLGLVFFGVACLITGNMLIVLRLIPRPIGWAMAAAGLVYLAGSYLRFLAPDLSAGFAPAYAVPLLAETAFCLWLLLRGVGRRAAAGRAHESTR